MSELKATREGFGDGLLDAASAFPNLVTIDADLRHSVQTMKFAKAHPERAFQVGIAEQNMIGVAAGLARAGKIPFAASFAALRVVSRQPTASRCATTNSRS
jgi:transketolase